MALSVTFQGGPRGGDTHFFTDDVREIVIGRDAASCLVLFPPDELAVGRRHCAIVHELDRYRLVLDSRHPVDLDGRPARDGQELPMSVRVRLGSGGPVLLVETIDETGLAETQAVMPHESRIRQIRRVLLVERGDIALAVGLAMILVAVLAGALAYGRISRHVEAIDARIRVTELPPDGVTEGLPDGGGKGAQGTPLQSGRLRRALVQARDSVLLVMIRDKSGRLETEATAWVAAPGVLATNAHVARLFDDKGDGKQLVVRTSTVPPRDFVVSAVERHPGYDAFRRLSAEYAPQREALDGTRESVDFAGGCDVALLRLEKADGLPAPLAMASAEELDALGAGDDVGSVGFPMERMVSGGVNVREPTPTVQVGYVTAVTDFFLGKPLSGDGYLIQHSLPLTGGSSGSPLVAASGHVIGILSSGNMVDSLEGRVPLAVGVNFAQRVDLLQELLDGTAEAAQQQRTAQWADDIQQFVKGALAMADRFADIEKKWQVEVAPLKGVRLHEETATFKETNDVGRAVARFSVELKDAGPHLVIAIAPHGEDVDLTLLGKDGKVMGADTELDSFPYVRADTEHPEKITAIVLGPGKGVEFTLRVLGAAKP